MYRGPCRSFAAELCTNLTTAPETRRNHFSAGSPPVAELTAQWPSTAEELRWTWNDSDESWTEDTSVGEAKKWWSITSNDDGTKLAAVVNGGSIWTLDTSEDSGAPWTEVTAFSGDNGLNWVSITSNAVGDKLAAVKGEIEVRDVTFAYPTRPDAPVCTKLSLKISAGQMVALVGPSGCGKSTLIQLLERFYDPTAGSVLLDGADLKTLNLKWLRSQLGLVAQEPILFLGSISDNIGYGKEGATKEEIEAAAKMANPHGFITEKEEGYNIQVGQGGGKLSGGQKQMLAISRALLANPKLLVMDEPTEGLAPVIVDQVAEMMLQLGHEGDMAILVIEQNIGVATSVSDTVAIMVNGQINRTLEASVLAADRDLQQRLLGVGRHAEDEIEPAEDTRPAGESARERLADVYVVARGEGNGAPSSSGAIQTVSRMPNRWNLPAASLRDEMVDRRNPTADEEGRKVFQIPYSERIGKTAFIAGTFDTKGQELGYLRDCIKKLGIQVRTIDLSTSQKPSRADVTPLQVAGYHPRGTSAVFSDDRGASVAAMAEAFARYMAAQRGVGGLISAGGSGGTSIATAGMRALPIGIPKVMVSTVASGDTRAYVGASDINMFHSVTDVQGLNLISERVLANAAHALAGMVARLPSGEEMAASRARARPTVGITMFGVTTTCVQAVQKEDAFGRPCHHRPAPPSAQHLLLLSWRYGAGLMMTRMPSATASRVRGAPRVVRPRPRASQSDYTVDDSCPP